MSTTDIPKRVQGALALLARQGIWHVVTRNSAATSCRDAAARRSRLGSTGIPLYDELKTMLAMALMPDGQVRHVLVHCRAIDQLDLAAAADAVGARQPLARAAQTEMSDAYGAEYGTVNPFSEAEAFIQVFDRGVLDLFTAPHSMMTNLGDLTWAVEFRPQELIDGLLRESVDVRVADVVAGALERRHVLPSFGIVTGNGPESGMALWESMNAAVHRRLSKDGRMRGDLSYPRVVVHSLPEMGLSMEIAQREDEVWAVIRPALDSLLASGVSHIALACNTTQYFEERIRQLCRPKGAEFVSMVDALQVALSVNHVEQATLIGIPRVAEMGQWSAFKAIRSRGIVPVPDAAHDALQELGYLIKRLDRHSADPRSLNKLQHILRSWVTTPWVIIALTEISILLSRFPKLRDEVGGRRVLDTLKITAEKMADVYVRSLPAEQIDALDDWSST